MKKKVLAFVAIVAILVMMIPMSVFAAEEKENKLQVQQTTDKTTYSASEDITTTLKITNNGDFDVNFSDIVMTNLTPNGYKVKANSKAEKEVEVLKTGETATLVTVFEKSTSPITGDGNIGEILFFGGMALLALGLILGIIFGKKKHKNITTIIICVLVAGAAIFAFANPTKAQDSKKKVSLSTNVTVDKKELEVKSTVEYDVDELYEVIVTKDGDSSFTPVGMTLADFRDDVNSGESRYGTYKGYTATLQKDIDLKNVNWEPIGTSTNPFSGVFDGQNYVIKNLTVNGSNGAEGLFGYVIGKEKEIDIVTRWKQDALTYDTFEIEKDLTCCVMNLKISKANITTTGGKKATGIIGSGECAYIYNIAVEDSTISGVKGVGGIIGNVNGCVIKNCSTDNNTSIMASVYNAGGIVGVGPNAEKSFIVDDQGKIVKHGCAIIGCINNADVTMTNPDESGYIGGIVGSFNGMGGQHNAFISCTNNGTIHIPQKSNGIGGIVGDAYSNGADQYFVNCTNNGSFDFSESSSCKGVGGIAQDTTVVGVNLINNADITAFADDVSGISSNAPQTPTFYNCVNNGTLENKRDPNKAYDISSKSGATIGVTGTFETVEKLNQKVGELNTDETIRRNFKLTNVTVTNKNDCSLIVPKNAESFVINGEVADTVEFAEEAICSSIVYANGYKFDITKNNSHGITIVGDNNTITVNSTLSSLGISGNSSVTVNADMTGSLNFSGTGTPTATISSGKTVHCVRFLGTGNYTVNNYGMITNNGGGGHVIYTESPCTITVNNHGTIQNRVAGPTYALLFYGGCDATVNKYPNSEIDTSDGTNQYGYKADGSAHSVVVRNVDDSGNPISE